MGNWVLSSESSIFQRSTSANQRKTFRFIAAGGEKLKYRFYEPRTRAAASPLVDQCLPELHAQKPLHPRPQRRITRWKHEDVLEAVQNRLDENPRAMRMRRETAEHPFGTMKMRMGGCHRDGAVRPHPQSDARLEHRRCARAARHHQGIGPAPHIPTST
jgi:hypothetical protein